jgi:dynein heavy chain, axonemal
VLYDSTEPQSVAFPEPWHEQLAPLQRMIVLRAFRPDKVVPAITDYVSDVMGRRYVEPLPFDLGACFEDSSPGVPLVFVLSAGSDPMANLLTFAASRNNTRVEAVSLGQGQGPTAIRLIEQAMREGFWVILQNCHLAASFMAELEQVCEIKIKQKVKKLSEVDPEAAAAADAEKDSESEGEGDGDGGDADAAADAAAGEGVVHPKFRLWLTSYPSPIFPISILENSVKMTNEAPKGLRAGLLRTFTSDPLSDPEFYESCSKPEAWRKMVFGLAFFHSYMQERRKYGAIGFNIPYEFNENDLRISIRQLKMFLDEYEEVPYDTLSYTCGECNYGGKVTDGHDRVTVECILKLFYCPEILTDGYAFSDSGLYRAPEHGEYQSYLDYVNTLPLIAAAEVYGFHANADITKDVLDTESTLDAFMMTQSRDESGGGKSAEEVIGEVAADLIERLPPNFDIELAEKAYPVEYYESMNTVLTQELGRVNVLLTVIRNSLVNLGKAVKGLVLMSDELDKVGKALYDGKVPAKWLKKSFPSLKPLGSYFREVVERVAFFRKWVDEGIPSTFPLYAFFFTQAFLTGSKQNYARKHKVEIDKVDFDYQVLDGDESSFTTKPEDGVYCFGMHLDGAAWSPAERSLCESEPKVLYCPAPGVHMMPAQVKDFKKYTHYSCPLYKTADRRGILSTTGHSTNFVMDIRMPCSQGNDHWIRRGACLLLSLKD